MKKTFPLQIPGKDDARILDMIKNDVRKYVKRERDKPLPAGFDQWTFECRVGANPESAESTPLKEISGAIDRVALAAATGVYIEIIAVPSQAPRRIMQKELPRSTPHYPNRKRA
jgi:hypothetical protein